MHGDKLFEHLGVVVIVGGVPEHDFVGNTGNIQDIVVVRPHHVFHALAGCEVRCVELEAHEVERGAVSMSLYAVDHNRLCQGLGLRL